LAFLPNFPELQKYQTILYFDHKIAIQPSHIEKLLKIGSVAIDASVIIRTTPRQKRHITDEINDAIKIPKYAKNMKKTIEFVQKKIQEKAFLPATQICNTGLLLYQNVGPIVPMLHNIYQSCISLQQPECQLFWSVFSYKYSSHIKIIDYTTISI
jgi:hypothetical protein